MQANPKQPPKKPTKQEIFECLNRSGYMLESKLVRRLDEASFFVEPNQSISDQRTGKSREIDILAEYFDPDRDHPGVTVITHFVMEVCNNTFPFVLMTTRPISPVMAPQEDYLKFVTAPREDSKDHPFLGELDLYESYGVEEWRPFSQWCALTRKKSGEELMASHSEDVYSSILKMAEYTLDTIEQWSSFSSDRRRWRVVIWRPVMVLKDDLMVLNERRGRRPGLKNVTSAKYEFNFHYKEQPRTMIIDFVTEANLIPFLMGIVNNDQTCEEHLFQIKGRI